MGSSTGRPLERARFVARENRFDLPLLGADGREALVGVESLTRVRHGVAALSRNPFGTGAGRYRCGTERQVVRAAVTCAIPVAVVRRAGRP